MEPISMMINEAKRSGMWLHCSYQDLWFSPGELEQARANGRFRWGAENFKLRDPRERLEQLQAAAESAKESADQFAKRLREAQ